MGCIQKTAALLSPEIKMVVEQLADILSPDTIYLYNQRVNSSGRSTGFKLCVVARTENKQEAERYAYMEIDCDVPFSLLLYTPEEWAQILAYPDSFACKIKQTGTMVYG